VIHGGILEVSKEQLNIFHCNLECSLGWVQTLFIFWTLRCCQTSQKARARVRKFS